MTVVAIGVDHQGTPSQLLECAAINGDDQALILERLLKSDHIAEAAVLSTCMRTEIYVDAIRYHGAVHDVRALLADISDQPVDHLDLYAFELLDDSVARHLFRVASGLESSVVGEPEVLGQVARSWEVAREMHATKAVLNGLFKRAIEVGKRARTETAISKGTTSIGQAAVSMVRSRIGDVAEKKVLIVGAGDMGDSMAVAIASKNHAGVKVTNRTAARAEVLAERVHGQAAPFADLPSLLAEADVVLSSTGSYEPVITASMVNEAMALRTEPIAFVDVAVPADVEIDVRDIPNVTVLNMDDLRSFADAGRAERAAEVKTVEALIDEEVWRYTADVNARTVVPVLAALREKVEAVRTAELQRQGKKLAELDPTTAAAVDSIINSVVAKLLHEPTVRLKAVAGQPEAERLTDAIRYLFDV